jgi:hypothetical protein
MRDRDLLIQETMAFAQRVAAAKPVRIETATQVEFQKRVELAQRKGKLFERDEIGERVAEFKATQRKFEREREEYFDKTMAKIRSNSSRTEA